MGDADRDQSDFSRNRWASSWHSAFFTIYCIVMVISLVLNMFLLRAIAKCKSKETPIYFFLLFLFFTSLVDDALIIQQFIMLYHTMYLTTFWCQLYTYVVYGNKILQAATVVTLSFYTWLYISMKHLRVEKWTKRGFPLIIVALLILELMLTIWAMLNIRASESGQKCYRVDNSYDTARRIGWVYLVLFPYFIPLILSIFPVLRLGFIVRQNRMPKVQATNVKIGFIAVISFFFFHLLYYILMLGREAEAMVVDRPEWRRILGLHVWYITRPMFALISYGWHIVLPLAPFAFDEDLFTVFPGNWINKNRLIARDEENKNSISMSETNSTSTIQNPPGENDFDSNQNSKEERSLGHISFVNPMMDADNIDTIEFQEYNQSVV